MGRPGHGSVGHVPIPASGVLVPIRPGAGDGNGWPWRINPEGTFGGRTGEFVGWARSGFLGHVFAIRAHMSTSIDAEAHRRISVHPGGVFYDKAGHVLDQIVWILGRPDRVTSFMRRDVSTVEGFTDNGLAVFEYESAMATIDIAAMEPHPTARRFEVYGDRGSAIMEPYEPADTLRLCLAEPSGSFPAGVSTIRLEDRKRYVASLEAFVKDLRGEKAPDRSLDHELLVQETLLRATGRVQS